MQFHEKKNWFMYFISPVFLPGLFQIFWPTVKQPVFGVNRSYIFGASSYLLACSSLSLPDALDSSSSLSLLSSGFSYFSENEKNKINKNQYHGSILISERRPYLATRFWFVWNNHDTITISIITSLVMLNESKEGSEPTPEEIMS